MPILYDVTRPLVSGFPVWPGDSPCQIEWRARLGPGVFYNQSAIQMSPHTGTHADGPFHLLADGAMIGAAPLDAYLGPARVVDAAGQTALDVEWAARVLQAGAPERLLVHTGAWTDPAVFPTAFAALEPEAARMLVDAGVRLFGTDAPSPDPFDSPDLPAHHVLLGAGAAILENVMLDGVPPGEYELIALPLKLMDAEASPIRAVLRGLEQTAAALAE
ncbi:MAG TPA: cyclase family protein [Longimicrobium sp.]|jgi:arylformamidase|nr:cyclase family protein [Longimicrobium sp.]